MLISIPDEIQNAATFQKDFAAIGIGEVIKCMLMPIQ